MTSILQRIKFHLHAWLTFPATTGQRLDAIRHQVDQMGQRVEQLNAQFQAHRDHAMSTPPPPPPVQAPKPKSPDLIWSTRHSQNYKFATEPVRVGQVSSLCRQIDLDHPNYRYWCNAIGENPRYHRKQWEFAYICQAMWENNLLVPGNKGVGFGVGNEPLPAYFAKNGCTILATDLDQDVAMLKGWTKTNQHAHELTQLNSRGICPPEVFKENVSFRVADMNHIPSDIRDYDFCWSACCLEHLGSLQQGLNFIENSLDLLKPGGFAIHTTEYNITSDTETLESGPCVIYRKRDLVDFAAKLTAAGHEVFPFNFDPGDQPVDQYIDLPPFTGEPHLKLQWGQFAVTSIGLIVRKRSL